MTKQLNEMKETSIEELFGEFADLKYLESEENEYVTNEKYAEIIKEITTKIEENVLREVVDKLKVEYLKIGMPMETGQFVYDHIKSLAESKGIKNL